MFRYATDFNEDISGWDVSAVYDQYVNQDISGWNVSSVTNMTGMFYYAEVFDQPLGTWDVSSVTNMNEDISFNQDIAMGWVGCMFPQSRI